MVAQGAQQGVESTMGSQAGGGRRGTTDVGLVVEVVAVVAVVVEVVLVVVEVIVKK